MFIVKFAFPLLYLLLKRHLKVITVACKHVLDGEEFSALNDSLVSVLLTIDHRVQNLEGRPFLRHCLVFTHVFQPFLNRPISTSRPASATLHSVL